MTPREQRIIEMHESGHTNKQIEEELGLARNYVGNIIRTYANVGDGYMRAFRQMSTIGSHLLATRIVEVHGIAA